MPLGHQRCCHGVQNWSTGRGAVASMHIMLAVFSRSLFLNAERRVLVFFGVWGWSCVCLTLLCDRNRSWWLLEVSNRSGHSWRLAMSFRVASIALHDILTCFIMCWCRSVWAAQYFCEVFRRWLAFFVAGAALWTCPFSIFRAKCSTFYVWCCVFFCKSHCLREVVTMCTLHVGHRESGVLCGRGIIWWRSVVCGMSQYLGHSRLYSWHSTLHTLHFALHTLHLTLCTLHSTLYTFHFSLNILRPTLHTLHFALHTLHLTLCTLHSTLYTFHFSLNILHPTLHTLHFTRHNASHFTLHTLYRTLHIYMSHCILYTLHFSLHTPHSTPYTLHCTLYTSHFTLHTLHFTLRTLHCTLHTFHLTLHTLHSTCHTPHYTLHSTVNTPHSSLSSHSTLCTPPHSAVYTGTVTGEKCARLLIFLFHTRVLRDCIRVRWFCFLKLFAYLLAKKMIKLLCLNVEHPKFQWFIIFLHVPYRNYHFWGILLGNAEVLTGWVQTRTAKGGSCRSRRYKTGRSRCGRCRNTGSGWTSHDFRWGHCEIGGAENCEYQFCKEI